jgi:hypothetical protein
MKRPWIILGLGLLAAVTAYSVSYWTQSGAWPSKPSGQPAELSWLQKEFQLSQSEYSRIVQLHEAYLPRCAVNCQKIEAINQKLTQLLVRTNRVTPDIEQALREAARIRADCQIMMLKHFYEVSQAMPAAQGKRYLEWMHAQTLLPPYPHPAEHHSSATPAHESSGH